ncbi:MAG: rhodanese-like domain-containing protein [Defluviitaleaceae bacterium]|nr:rhodanese-like domain-containing protein [Defluviitaleaceae bacterium]
MYFKQITTPGLGCYSYVIGCPKAATMAVVDPRRDIAIYQEISNKMGMELMCIFETHVHADHISGAQELSAATYVPVYAHESTQVTYKYKILKHDDEYTFGPAHVRILHTPGHTPNSISLLITDQTRSKNPQLILTGDLLFVGDIGRPDLPGEAILDQQIQDLYNSLHTVLGQLPDYLEVYPAHGEGSLCGSGMSAKPHTTLGYERKANPMLRHRNFESFKTAIRSKNPMRPQSFASIISTNLSTVPPSPARNLPDFSTPPSLIPHLQKQGTQILDLRDSYAFASAHIPGSINIDFTGGPKLNWVGVAITPGTPLLLILPPELQFEDVYLELQRIGYDNVQGYLNGGINAWISSGKLTQSTPYITAAEVKLTMPNPPAIIDVRSPEEFATKNINTSINYTFDDIINQAPYPAQSDKEAVIVCKSGFRAAIAASLLKAQGHKNISILIGGTDAWK